MVRGHPAIYFALLATVTLSCGGGDRPTGRYQLSIIEGTNDVGCSDDFIAFISTALGGIPGTQGIIELEEEGESSVRLTLEGGTGVSLVLAPASDSASELGWEYEGAASGTITPSGCSVRETLTVSLATAANNMIEVGLVDVWENTPVTAACPFVADVCTNSFNYLGSRI